jgi:tetratricopeptide (TPR) repeat protein
MISNQYDKSSQLLIHILLGFTPVFTSLTLLCPVSAALPLINFKSMKLQQSLYLFRYDNGILIGQTGVAPSNKDAKFRLAMRHYNLGMATSKINKAKAIKSLEIALSIFVDLGDKENEKKVRSVIKSLKSVEKSKSPDDLFRDILSEKNSQKKMEALDLLVQNHPDFVDAYIYRGQTYQAKKDYQKAIQDFDQALYLEPDLTKVIKIHEILGELYTEINDTQNAFKDFDQAIQLLQDEELNEERTLQKISIAIIEFERNEALGHRSVYSPPSIKDSEYRLANIYYRKGIIYQKRGMLASKIDKARAIKDLQIALEIFTKLSNKTDEQKVRAAINSLK